MSERSLDEMSNEELIAELIVLRQRRAQARERKAAGVKLTEEEKKAKKQTTVTEIKGELGDKLDEFLSMDDD